MGLIGLIGTCSAFVVRLYNRWRRKAPDRLDEVVKGYRQAVRVVAAFTTLVEAVLNALSLSSAPLPPRPLMPSSYPRRIGETQTD